MAKRITSSPSSQFSLKAFFLPTIVIACLLPILTFAVVYGVFDNFLPRAAEQNTLRVWIEPNTVVVREGQSTSLSIMAAYDKPTGLVSSFFASLSTDADSTLSKTDISYPQPFEGKTSVGTVEFKSQTKGTHEVSVVKDSVSVAANALPSVLVGGATIIVK